MRIKHNLLILVLCFVMIVATSSTTVFASIFDEIESRGSVRIGINSGVRPFTFLDYDGNPTGFCVDLGRLIGERMGVEVEFVDMDWAGLIPSLLTHRIDIIGDRMSNTLERAKSISFADSYMLTGTMLYTRKDSGFKSIQELNKEGVRIGAILGAVGESIARTKLPNAEIILFDTTADTTEALLAGRVDAAAEDDTIAYAEVSKVPDRLHVLPGYLMVDTYSFAVRQGDVELLFWLNLFFEQIKRSGEFGQLYEKWLEVPWNPIPQKQL